MFYKSVNGLKQHSCWLPCQMMETPDMDFSCVDWVRMGKILDIFKGRKMTSMSENVHIYFPHLNVSFSDLFWIKL